MIVDFSSTGYDTPVGVALDEFGGVLTIHTSVDHVRDMEGHEWYDYEPGFHTFLLRSVDLVHYDLFVDGEHAFSDFFKVPTGLNSFVGWGDGTSSYSSSWWDFVRFGSATLGDISVDGRVNLSDFSTFAVCFTGPGASGPPASCSDRDYALSDLDHDGDVDLADFSTFAVNFGR